MSLNERLIADLVDARTRLLSLLDDLSDDELEVPRLAIVNPPLWEAGHVAWFQEHWTLRHLAGRPSLRSNADALWDSAAVAHDTRWELPLPSRGDTLAYMSSVLEQLVGRLRERTVDAREAYFHRLVTLHEDMHGEALVYTRQTLGLPAPRAQGGSVPGGGPCPGDVEIAGGVFDLGAHADLPFVFDNEKWAHALRVAPFRIARAPVTQAQFLEFVEAGGYERDEFWSLPGLNWRNAARAQHPLYWRRDSDGSWLRIHYDGAVALEAHKPVHHVSWYEAQAFCNFSHRRLPTEAEWECAASQGRALISGDEPLDAKHKPLYPWGDSMPDAARAHLDLRQDGCCEVGAYPQGDSAAGCRQMIGNVWEWTASDFGPYPGFVADPYREYSEPWFGTHKVLRGGCFATRARLVRNTWRNFYTPDRRDVLSGFRTCAR